MKIKSASLAILATLLASCALSVGINDMDRSVLSQVKIFDLPHDRMTVSEDDSTMLAQKSKSSSRSRKSSSSKSKSGSGDDWGIASFIAGCLAIPFALVALWKNEKKIVTFTKCIELGKEAVRTVDNDDPDDANEFELVHLTGASVNSVEIVDNDFGIVAHNSYRLKRKAEMYQWRE